ncbi:glucose-1-phosphate adenylyltransferase [Treponema sp.]|uniref:glucose-1-phosphate adenylyltransferase n=1 Tax=Treponema sp. TaxID=166 RepID=UPI0025DEC0CF|nr:glucose-1-phosphate adenylyltransferase [Treponema sp.]MBQ7539315.1 glucose-1-phosphate adenylyltransferase [Treponema sp.]MBR4323584.1 glucose-1-phosphate adenylyltransferase [Treponema sp.]
MANSNEPRVLAIILGGGKGTRLYPLTKERSKPAVPFGGKYRIVDIPISNCINSGYRKIYLLTQFNSASLHHHITNSYNFDRFSKGFVEILAAEQTLEHSGWFEGTADAVRKNFIHFKSQNPTHYIILSGDQLYRMDLKAFMDSHIKSGADITIATTAVNERDATGFGIMKIDSKQAITEFIEKPSVDVLKSGNWKIPANARGDLPAEKEYLASMGIYIFNAKTMEEALDNDFTDFGKEIIPRSIKSKKVNSYIFNGYWEDIGTIRSFYNSTLDLTNDIPPFNFYDADAPIYTHMRNLPPPKINGAPHIENSILAEGCMISNAKAVTKSVVGVRTILNEGSELNGVITMGADFYENDETKAENAKAGRPNIGIGKNCKIAKAIIDKDAAIGDNVRINVDGKAYPDGENKLESGVSFYSSDGIIVIRKGSVIPSGTVI